MRLNKSTAGHLSSFLRPAKIIKVPHHWAQVWILPALPDMGIRQTVIDMNQTVYLDDSVIQTLAESRIEPSSTYPLIYFGENVHIIRGLESQNSVIPPHQDVRKFLQNRPAAQPKIGSLWHGQRRRKNCKRSLDLQLTKDLRMVFTAGSHERLMISSSGRDSRPNF